MLGCHDWIKKRKEEKKEGAANLFSFWVLSIPFEISYSLLFVALQPA
jgi:hypothetical protein